MYNDSKACWPTQHLLNIVKKWTVELKLFKEESIDFKKLSAHSFEIICRELLPTPLASIKDPNLGWAELGTQYGLKDKALTTHMPRISIATLAVKAGLTGEQLKKLGNWMAAASAEGYVRLRGKDLKGLQHQIIVGINSSSILFPTLFGGLIIIIVTNCLSQL